MNHARKKRKTIWVDDFEARGFRTENGLITNGKQYVAGIAINDRESIYTAESIGYWIGFTFVAEPEMNIKDMEPIDVYELPVGRAFSNTKLMNPKYELRQDKNGYHVIYETTILMLQGCRFIHKKTFEIERKLDQLLKSIAAMRDSLSDIEEIAPYVPDYFKEWLDNEKKIITEGTLSYKSVKYIKNKSLENNLEKSLDAEGFRNRKKAWKRIQENRRKSMEHTKSKRKAIWGDDLEKEGFFRAENGLIMNEKQYVNGIVINDREGVYAAEDIDWIGFPFVAEPKVNTENMEPVDVYELPVEGAFSDAKLMNPVYELGQDEIGCHVIHETVTLMLQGCRFIHEKTFRTENTDPWLRNRKEAWKRTQKNIAQKIRP